MFIKLTQTTGVKIRINMDLMESYVMNKEKDKTHIWIHGGDEQDKYMVVETPEEIDELIDAEISRNAVIHRRVWEPSEED